MDDEPWRQGTWRDHPIIPQFLDCAETGLRVKEESSPNWRLKEIYRKSCNGVPCLLVRDTAIAFTLQSQAKICQHWSNPTVYKRHERKSHVIKPAKIQVYQCGSSQQWGTSSGEHKNSEWKDDPNLHKSWDTDHEKSRQPTPGQLLIEKN